MFPYTLAYLLLSDVHHDVEYTGIFTWNSRELWYKLCKFSSLVSMDNFVHSDHRTKWYWLSGYVAHQCSNSGETDVKTPPNNCEKIALYEFKRWWGRST